MQAFCPNSCRFLIEPFCFRTSETLSLKLSWKYFFDELLSLYFFSLASAVSFCPSFLVLVVFSLPELLGVTLLAPFGLPVMRVKLDYLAELRCLDELRFFS